MMAVGGLIATLCGLCTMTFLVGVGSVFVTGRIEAILSILATVGILGGLPIGLGVALFMGGLAKYRQPQRPWTKDRSEFS